MIQIAYPLILSALIVKALDPQGNLRKRLAEEAEERKHFKQQSNDNKRKNRS